MNELVGRIAVNVNSRVRQVDPLYTAVRRRVQSPSLQLPDKTLAASYIQRKYILVKTPPIAVTFKPACIVSPLPPTNLRRAYLASRCPCLTLSVLTDPG